MLGSFKTSWKYNYSFTLFCVRKKNLIINIFIRIYMLSRSGKTLNFSLTDDYVVFMCLCMYVYVCLHVCVGVNCWPHFLYPATITMSQANYSNQKKI